MRERTSRQKNIVIVGLLIIILAMAIGYAAFATQLNVNGTINIENTWCVGFDSTKTSDYVATPGVSGGTVPTGSISFDGNTCATNYKTDASLTAAFKQPGDKIVYTLTIANKSSFTSAIKSIRVENENVTSNKTITKRNVKYTVEMPEATTLAANATTTMKVTAEFQNDTDIGQYTTGESQTISVQINAQQDDGNGGFVKKYTGSIYRWNANKVQNGCSITEPCATSNASDEITEEEIGEYTTDASTLNKNYYLKHDIVEDIITASYVCFVYDNTEHCMKGADWSTSFATNTQIIEDYQRFNKLPDNANPGCYFYRSYSHCYGGGFYKVYAVDNSYVSVNGSSSEYCYVGANGYSACYQY